MTGTAASGFGVHSEVGKLRKVMVCAPGLAHRRLTPTNCHELLFDDVMWVENARRDHFDFIPRCASAAWRWWRCTTCSPRPWPSRRRKKWLLDRKVVPNQVGLGLVDEPRSYLDALDDRHAGGDADRRPVDAATCPTRSAARRLATAREAAGVTEYLLPPLPNTLYTRDTTCWIYGGVTLNPLYWPARHEETLLTTAIYKFHPDFAGKVNVWWGDPDAGPRPRHARGRRRHADRQGRRPDRHERAHFTPGHQPGGGHAVREGRCRARDRRRRCRSCARRCTWTRCSRSPTATW